MQSKTYSDYSVEFVLYIGLPGSGKTTQAGMHAVLCSFPVLLLDDMSLNFDGAIERFNSQVWRRVLITDPKLCGVSQESIEATIKRNFKCDNYSFRYIYFENDPVKCKKNSKHAPKPGGVEHFIDCVSKVYTIPDGADTMPVMDQAEAASMWVLFNLGRYG